MAGNGHVPGLGGRVMMPDEADTPPDPSTFPQRTPGRDDMTAEEKQIFNYLLRPDDNYNEAGVYWADMSVAQQVKFVLNADRKETQRELSGIWAMFKADPLSPVSHYFRNMVLPGAGLGLEG